VLFATFLLVTFALGSALSLVSLCRLFALSLVPLGALLIGL